MQIKLLIFSLFLLAGCGLKTSLVVYDDTATMPSMSQLSYQIDAEKITFNLDIQGGSGAVSYHIDRAVVQPDCQCVGHWLRYYESTPSRQRLGLKRQIKLRSDTVYAFRLRAVDALGRKSAWSKTIKTKVENVNE